MTPTTNRRQRIFVRFLRPNVQNHMFLQQMQSATDRRQRIFTCLRQMTPTTNRRQRIFVRFLRPSVQNHAFLRQMQSATDRRQRIFTCFLKPRVPKPCVFTPLHGSPALIIYAFLRGFLEFEVFFYVFLRTF